MMECGVVVNLLVIEVIFKYISGDTFGSIPYTIRILLAEGTILIHEN